MVSGRRPSKTHGFLRFSKRPRNPLRTLGWSTFENSWFFLGFQNARATLCGLWAGRPAKTRGFLRFSNRPRDPLRTLGWSTFENSWFFAIFKSSARPSADFGLVDLRKLVVFCDFQLARATLCGLWAGRPSKTRGFLRFSNRPRDPLRTLGWSTFENSWFFAIFNSLRDPLRTLGWSTFENSWFFAIFKSPARPSADFGLVNLRKLVVFCDFEIACATLCGVWAGRPSKTRGLLQFSNRSRDPLRSFAWSNRSRCGAALILMKLRDLSRCQANGICTNAN